MNYNNLYEPVPALIQQVLRKQREKQWTYSTDENRHLKGVTVSKEFKDTLYSLANERNRDPTIIIKDGLNRLIDLNRPVWVDRSAYTGDEQIMFRFSDRLNHLVREYDGTLSCMVKQGVVGFFEQSGTDFDKLVKEKGDTDAGL